MKRAWDGESDIRDGVAQMPYVTKRLGVPSPRKATTLEMCRVIARASGVPLATVWRAHPLGRHGRCDLVQHYIYACNALDFGVDCATGAEISLRRVMSMLFGDEHLHPLDAARKEASDADA